MLCRLPEVLDCDLLMGKAGTGLANAMEKFEVKKLTNRIDKVEDFVIEWDSVAGREYHVLSRTNFTAPSWKTNVSGIVGDGTKKVYTNSEANPHGFFKINVTKP